MSIPQIAFIVAVVGVIIWIWRDVRFAKRIKDLDKRLDARVKVHTAAAQMLATMVVVCGFWLTFKQNADNTAQQIENQKQGNLTLQADRFQKSVGCLGNASRSVRLSGIITLENLAYEDPKQFEETAISLISAFIRDNAARSNSDEVRKKGDFWPPVDVLGALNTLSRLIQRAERNQRPRGEINLRGIVLSGKKPTSPTVLHDLALSGVDLEEADLSNCMVRNCDLNDANLRGVNLTNSSITVCRLRRSNLRDADLTGAGWIGNLMDGAQFHGATLILAEGRHSENEFIGARASRKTSVPSFWSTNHLSIEPD